MTEIEQIAEKILLETVKELALKKLNQNIEKRKKAETKIIHNVNNYKLLKEPESKVVGEIDITPEKGA